LQYGEWLRRDLLDGVYEPAVVDPDLAILLRMAREHSIALVGPAAIVLFEPVPADDFLKALADTVAQWNEPADWEGDARNVVLALARIWYSVATGRLAPKDVAAAWALERLPAEHTPVLQAARGAYLGAEEEGPGAERDRRMIGFVRYVRSAIAAGIDLALLASQTRTKTAGDRRPPSTAAGACPLDGR
jgi:streptomycin 3"-adenylyltransferase